MIIGDGPAALFVVAVSKIFRASDITIFGYNEYRLQIAEKIGASSINSDKNCVDFINEFIGENDGGLFDVVLK